MTSVVSDTSPINYLCLIGEIDLLARLFDAVLIPPAVLAELQHPKAPRAVADWLRTMPPWVTIETPASAPEHQSLDAGEAEAIALAIERGIQAILIDDRAGWVAAQTSGLIPLGTLSILDAADLAGFVDCEAAIIRLRQTNFHVDQGTIEGLIDRVRLRKSA